MNLYLISHIPQGNVPLALEDQLHPWGLGDCQHPANKLFIFITEHCPKKKKFVNTENLNSQDNYWMFALVGHVAPSVGFGSILSK